MFGANEVCDTLRPILQNALTEENSINKENLISTFFWILKDDALIFIFDQIEKTDHQHSNKLTISYGQNEFSHSKDAILRLLQNYYLDANGISEVIQLAIAYVMKNNYALPELAHDLKKHFTIRYEDHENGYFRQNTLIDTLTKTDGAADDCKIRLFYHISEALLSSDYQYTESTGKRNGSMYITTISISPNSAIKQLRTKMWKYIDDNFDRDRELVFTFLKSYPAFRFKYNSDIISDDLHVLIDILKVHVKTELFEEAVLVYNLKRRLNLYKITNTQLDELVEKCGSLMLEFYKVMNWRWLGKKYKNDYDHETAVRLKEEQLNSSVVIKTKPEVYDFIRNTLSVLNVVNPKNHSWEVGNCVTTIIANTIQINAKLGLYFVLKVIDSEVADICNDTYLMARLMEGGINFDEIESGLKNLDPGKSDRWILALHIVLKEEDIDHRRCKSLLDSISNLTRSRMLFACQFKRYILIDNAILSKILTTGITKNKTDIKITLFNDFYDEYYAHIKCDLKVVKIAFIEQQKLLENFDHDNKGLLNIVRDDKSFLFDYIKDGNLNEDKGSIPEIWELDGIEIVLEKILMHIAGSEYFFDFSDNKANLFFRKVDDKNRKMAKDFLIGMVLKYNANSNMMTIIADISRTSFKDFFEVVVKTYLSVNKKEEDFGEITWISTNGVYSGNALRSDRQIRRVQRLLDIVKENYTIDLFPIKNKLIKELTLWKAENKREHRRKFADPFYF